MAASQEKIRVYCIEKHHNKSGAITEYILGDEFGNTSVLTRKDMVATLRDRNYEVMNLQLDKLGRIVEKAVPTETKAINEINKRIDATDISSIFDKAYGLIKHRQMPTIAIHNNEIVRLDEPFDKLADINIKNIDEFLIKFEDYLASKYKFKPTKLEIINGAKGWRYIQYGEQYLECTITNEDKYYPGISSSELFRVNMHSNSNLYRTFKRTGNIADETGKIVENALCGIIVYDLNNEDAKEWAHKRVEELDAKINSLSKPNKLSKQGSQSKPNRANTSKNPLVGMMKMFDR